MEPYLPREIIYRRKKGFGIPIGEWFKGPLKSAVAEFLHPRRLDAQGLFNPGYVKRLLQEHFDGKKDNRKKLWTLFIFQKWYDCYFAGEGQ